MRRLRTWWRDFQRGYSELDRLIAMSIWAAAKTKPAGAFSKLTDRQLRALVDMQDK